MVYKWGTIKYPVAAQDAGQELQRIERKYQAIDPAIVVHESKRKDALLYPIFEWDNKKAGQKWREQQARVMIGNLVTVMCNEQQEENEIRTFVSVRTAEEKRQYVSLNIAMGNENYKEQVLVDARREFEEFRRKYKHLKEFAKIFEVYTENAFEEIKEGLRLIEKM